MLFIVSINVVAGRPPERWPTGTPTTRANKSSVLEVLVLNQQVFINFVGRFDNEILTITSFVDTPEMQGRVKCGQIPGHMYGASHR